MSKQIRKRIDIIYALRSYAHPSMYHDLLNWPTEALDALLTWYETEGRADEELVGILVVAKGIKADMVEVETIRENITGKQKL